MATIRQETAFKPGKYRGIPFTPEKFKEYVEGSNRAIQAGIPIPLLKKHAPINASDSDTQAFATDQGEGAGWVTQFFVTPTGNLGWEATGVPSDVAKAVQDGTVKFTSPEFRPHYVSEKEGAYEGPVIRHMAFTPLPGNPHQGSIDVIAMSEKGCFQFSESDYEPLEESTQHADSDFPPQYRMIHGTGGGKLSDKGSVRSSRTREGKFRIETLDHNGVWRKSVARIFHSHEAAADFHKRMGKPPSQHSETYKDFTSWHKAAIENGATVVPLKEKGQNTHYVARDGERVVGSYAFSEGTLQFMMTPPTPKAPKPKLPEVEEPNPVEAEAEETSVTKAEKVKKSLMSKPKQYAEDDGVDYTDDEEYDDEGLEDDDNSIEDSEDDDDSLEEPSEEPTDTVEGSAETLGGSGEGEADETPTEAPEGSSEAPSGSPGLLIDEGTLGEEDLTQGNLAVDSFVNREAKPSFVKDGTEDHWEKAKGYAFGPGSKFSNRWAVASAAYRQMTQEPQQEPLSKSSDGGDDDSQYSEKKPYKVFNNGGAGWSVRHTGSKKMVAFYKAQGKPYWSGNPGDAAVYDSAEQAHEAARNAMPHHPKDWDEQYSEEVQQFGELSDLVKEYGYEVASGSPSSRAPIYKFPGINGAHTVQIMGNGWIHHHALAGKKRGTGYGALKKVLAHYHDDQQYSEEVQQFGEPNGQYKGPKHRSSLFHSLLAKYGGRVFGKGREGWRGRSGYKTPFSIPEHQRQEFHAAARAAGFKLGDHYTVNEERGSQHSEQPFNQPTNKESGMSQHGEKSLSQMYADAQVEDHNEPIHGTHSVREARQHFYNGDQDNVIHHIALKGKKVVGTARQLRQYLYPHDQDTPKVVEILSSQHAEEEEPKDPWERAEHYLSLANDAKNKIDYHGAKSKHHDALVEWHESKGRYSSADKHADKAHFHEEKMRELLKGTPQSYAEREPGEEEFEDEGAEVDVLPPELMPPPPSMTVNPDMPPVATDQSKMSAALAGLAQKGVVLPSDFNFMNPASIDILLAALNSSIKAEQDAEAEAMLNQPGESPPMPITEAAMPYSEGSVQFSEKKKVAKALWGQDSPASDPTEHSYSNGEHTIRRGFFYTNGKTSQHHADEVSKALKEAGIDHTVVDHGQVDKPFKGGSSTKQNSHWWVSIRTKPSQHSEQFAEPGRMHSVLRKAGWKNVYKGDKNRYGIGGEGNIYYHDDHPGHALGVLEKEGQFQHMKDSEEGMGDLSHVTHFGPAKHLEQYLRTNFSSSVKDQSERFSEQELKNLPPKVRIVLEREAKARKDAERKAAQFAEEKRQAVNQAARDGAITNIKQAKIPPAMKQKLLAHYQSAQFSEGTEAPSFTASQVATLIEDSLPASIRNIQYTEAKEAPAPKANVLMGKDPAGNPILTRPSSEQFFEEGAIASGHMSAEAAEAIVSASPILGKSMPVTTPMPTIASMVQAENQRVPNQVMRK